MLLKKTLENPLDSKEIKPINPKGNSLEGLMLKFQYFGPLMQRANSLEKTLILGKMEGRRWRQRMRWLDDITDSMDMMVGWYHWLNGHEFEQTLGDSEGWGSLGCWDPGGRLNNDNNLIISGIWKGTFLTSIVEWLGKRMIRRTGLGLRRTFSPRLHLPAVEVVLAGTHLIWAGVTSFHQFLNRVVHIQDTAHQTVHLLVQTLKSAEEGWTRSVRPGPWGPVHWLLWNCLLLVLLWTLNLISSGSSAGSSSSTCHLSVRSLRALPWALSAFAHILSGPSHPSPQLPPLPPAHQSHICLQPQHYPIWACPPS